MKTEKIWCGLMLILMLVCTVACAKKPTIDYADAESFEAALNSGENLEGKVVQFVADEVHPRSARGYNIWAGEHLNFVSRKNPDVRQGDTVTVKATTIESNGGSWFIEYERIDDATNKKTDSSDKTEKNGTKSFSTSSSMITKAVERKLEITDRAIYFKSASVLDKDSVYFGYVALIHNPNGTLIAQFPKINITIKAGDGTIVTTDSATGSTVMPGDTVALIGTVSIPKSAISDDTKVSWQVECSDFTTDGFVHSEASTADFTVSNVSERMGRSNSVTGELKNNFLEDMNSVCITVVFRKDGKIVYAEDTFIDNLTSGQTKAFEITSYSDWPEHDTIDVTAMAWG